jgi:hypothetical protein
MGWLKRCVNESLPLDSRKKTINMMLSLLQTTDYLRRRNGLKCLAGLILSSVLLASHVRAEPASRIVKWKDDKGVTHYADSIPAEYANRESSVISKQGVTVKRNKPGSPQATALYMEKLEQDKKDRALLSTFTNENEIDLALERNLQLDQVILENLQRDQAHIEKRLAASKKTLALLAKNKKPVPPELPLEIANNQADIAQLDERINTRKANIAQLKQRFADDKERYISLKNHDEIAPAAGVPAKNP